MHDKRGDDIENNIRMLQIWLGRRDMNISGTLEDAKD
jgi:hypothetical protein